MKNIDIFHIFVQNIHCGYSLEPPRRGGSNEYPQSMFLSRNKKNNVYPYKPQFYYIKVGFKGVIIIKACFRDGEWQTVYQYLNCHICKAEHIYTIQYNTIYLFSIKQIQGYL